MRGMIRIRYNNEMKFDDLRMKYSPCLHRERVEEEKMRGEERNGFLSLWCC